MTRALLFVGSAAAAAAALLAASRDPRVGVLILLVTVGIVATRWMRRRSLTQLLHSGDVRRILARWGDAFERVPHAKTMEPLLRATAFAACGWVREAREAMEGAERGPAWDAAIEHRLFVDTMIAAFDGERIEAIQIAERLFRLPLPSDPAFNDRARMLRMASMALARAFARRSQPQDVDVLLAAAEESPLIFWAMRYGAAVASIHLGDKPFAETLISEAPTWPQQSAFRTFHREIAAQLA